MTCFKACVKRALMMWLVLHPSIKASTLFDELVLPGCIQKFTAKRQSAHKAYSGRWLALPQFLGL